MKLTRDNLEVFAAKFYTNETCLSVEEFRADLEYLQLIKKMAAKVKKGSSSNLRLLLNHVICFTNNFELRFVKLSLLEFLTVGEQSVVSAVMLYLGFLAKDEYEVKDLDLNTIKLLKELDR